MLQATVQRILGRFDVGLYRPSKHAATHEQFDLSALPPVDQVVDIGVAYGTPWLYRAFPDAELLLVDPVPRRPELDRVLADRPHRFVCAACGAADGDADLTVDLGHTGRSSLLERTELTASGAATRTRRVRVRPLDAIVREELSPGGRIGVKIDTEGYELEVLKGAEATLARAEFVICEASVQERFVGSYRLEELLLFLHERGFVLAQVLDAPRNRAGMIPFLDLAFVRGGAAVPHPRSS